MTDRLRCKPYTADRWHHWIDRCVQLLGRALAVQLLTEQIEAIDKIDSRRYIEELLGLRRSSRRVPQPLRCYEIGAAFGTAEAVPLSNGLAALMTAGYYVDLTAALALARCSCSACAEAIQGFTNPTYQIPVSSEWHREYPPRSLPDVDLYLRGDDNLDQWRVLHAQPFFDALQTWRLDPLSSRLPGAFRSAALAFDGGDLALAFELLRRATSSATPL